MKTRLLFILLGMSTVASAQQRIGDFRIYSRSDGLPPVINSCVFQSSDGYIWIGTYNGLLQYDGYTFKRHYAIFPNSISDNMITDISEDNSGHLWVSTYEKGLSRYDLHTNIWNKYTNPLHDADPFFDVTDVFKDEKGELWFGTSGRGLMHYLQQTDSFEQFVPQPEHAFHEFNKQYNSIREITADPHDQDILWLATMEGLFSFSKRTHAFTRYTIQNGPDIEWKDNCFHCIQSQQNGMLWLGTWGGGLKMFNTSTHTFTSFLPDQKEYKRNNLSTNIVSDIFELNPGVLYISSNNFGLMEFDIASSSFKRVLYDNMEGLNVRLNPCLNIARTRDGSIWVSAMNYLFRKNPLYERFGYYQSLFMPSNLHLVYPPDVHDAVVDPAGKGYYLVSSSGYGIYYYDSLFHYQRSYFVKDTKKKEFAFWNAAVDNGQNLWVTSPEQPFVVVLKKGTEYLVESDSSFCPPAGILNAPILNLKSDSHGCLWFYVYKKGLLYYDPSTKQYHLYSLDRFSTNNQPFAANTAEITFDSQSNVWLATSKGLFVLNNKDKQWKYLHIGHETPDAKSDQFVCGLALNEKANELWLASRANGIEVRRITDNSLVRQYNVTNGFLSQNVNFLQKDSEGNIWACTNDGLACFDHRKKSWKFYTQRDGLLKDYCDQTIICLSDGTNLLAQYNGYLRFNGKQLPENTWSPVMHITGLSIYGKDDTSGAVYNTSGRIKIPWQQNQLSIAFSAIETLFPDQADYYYRLDGLDKDWIHTRQHRIEYGGLSAGVYTFRVRASNSEGIFSKEEAKLSFEILPPFWQTTWFRWILATVAGAAIYFAFRSRVNRIVSKERQKSAFEKKLMQVEMKALRSQMNPHFIFNCLSAIKHLVQTGQPDEAVVYLNDFSSLIRSVLNNSEKQMISLEEELQMCRMYLNMEALRFGNKMQFSIEVQEDVQPGAVEIPPLLLQPYLENAVWHGLMHKKEGSKRITVAVKKNGNAVRINIDDNGVGRNHALHSSNRTSSRRSSKGMLLSSERLQIASTLENKPMQVRVIDKTDEEGKASGTCIEITIANFNDEQPV